MRPWEYERLTPEETARVWGYVREVQAAMEKAARG